MTILTPALPSLLPSAVVTRALDGAAWFCSRRIAFLVMGVLAIGTTLSILTTADPLWWQLHFSKLGTFHDFSGFVFNGTLISAGLIIVWFASRVRAELRTLAALRTRKPSRLMIALMVSVGVHLSVVGMIPVNTNTWLHDRAASGLMLSFLGILIVTLRLWKHVPPRLVWATIAVAAGLVLAIVGFAFGLLNLAALELVGFTLIFVWIGQFTACVRVGIRYLEQQTAASAANDDEATADCLRDDAILRPAVSAAVVSLGSVRSDRDASGAPRVPTEVHRVPRRRIPRTGIAAKRILPSHRPARQVPIPDRRRSTRPPLGADRPVAHVLPRRGYRASAAR